MDPATLQNLVKTNLVSSGPATALTISREVGCTREEANRTLYALLKTDEVFREGASPPLWSVLPLGVPSSSLTEPRRLVVVDLGNTHDCLRELLPYARAGAIEVRAYADLAYNGFGVTPALTDVPGVSVQQATTAEKNAADVDMIWDLAELLGPGEPKYFVAVATKDQGFRRLKALAEARGHRLEFATGWSELRHYVE
jgi:hypothetical protein